MKELEAVLLRHAKTYPLMEPTDAVKLIYQNEFGGGHLVRDEAAARKYLSKEYAGIEKDPTRLRYEPIGNGLVRVHLAALHETDLDALAEQFIRSAAIHKGSLPRFLEKLELLRHLTAEGLFGFSSQALHDYLDAYAEAGYPMVSHSEAYRQAYRPAYRVVLAPERPM